MSGKGEEANDLNCRFSCAQVNNELTRVEMPCFVNSTNQALAMMGGEDNVHDIIRGHSGTNLQLRFPSNSNPSRGNLFAVSRPKSGILLKLKRRKGSGADASVSVVGIVPQSYQFSNPADYQFLPGSIMSTATSEENASHRILDTPPCDFSRDNVVRGTHFLNLAESIRKQPASIGPNKSASSTSSAVSASVGAGITSSAEAAINGNDEIFDATTGVGTGAAGAAGTDTGTVKAAGAGDSSSSSRNPDKGMAYYIGMEDAVPTSHPRGACPPQWLNEKDDHRGLQMLKQLRDLFSVIPILSRVQIEMYLNLQGRVFLFKTCLPYVAYCYVKGPFRRLWVRFGYDPSKSPDSAVYQTLFFRISPLVVRDITDRISKRVGSALSRSKMVDLDALEVSEMPLNSVTYLIINKPQSDPSIFIYNHMLKHQLMVQLFQIMDQAILDFFKTVSLRSTFDLHTGWYSEETMKTFRVMALKLIPQRINAFLSLPSDQIFQSALSTQQQQQQTQGSQALSNSMFAVMTRTIHHLANYLSVSAVDLSSSSNSESCATAASAAAGEGQRGERKSQTHDGNEDQEQQESSPPSRSTYAQINSPDGVELGRQLCWLRRYQRAATMLPFSNSSNSGSSSSSSGTAINISHRRISTGGDIDTAMQPADGPQAPRHQKQNRQSTTKSKAVTTAARTRSSDGAEAISTGSTATVAAAAAAAVKAVRRIESASDAAALSSGPRRGNVLTARAFSIFEEEEEDDDDDEDNDLDGEEVEMKEEGRGYHGHDGGHNDDSDSGDDY